MPKLIAAPTVIAAAGTKPKKIEEFAGRVNSGHSAVSVARMISPGGWEEPGQRPEFEEITVVLKGTLRVEHENFRDAVLGKDADIVTMEQGLTTVRVAEACIESATTGQTISLTQA